VQIRSPERALLAACGCADLNTSEVAISTRRPCQTMRPDRAEIDDLAALFGPLTNGFDPTTDMAYLARSLAPLPTKLKKWRKIQCDIPALPLPS